MADKLNNVLTGARGRFRRGLLTGLCAGVMALATFVPQVRADDAKTVDIATAEKKDVLILKNGNKVEGVILSETDTEVKFLLILGSIRSQVTYAKADITAINRNAFETTAAATDAPKADDKDDEPAATAGQLVDVNNKPIPADSMKVYFVRFGGEFGRDVSRTPVKRIMDEIVRIQPDIVVVQFDHKYSLHGEQKVDFQDDADDAYAQLDTARELDVLISDRARNDPAFKVRPRMVAWVKKAMGGAAFLPFTFPEIFFSSDAHMGGIGGLETFRQMGDLVTQEKMRGIMLGRARGLAEKGGHDSRIITAMTRGEMILSYRMVGGKPEFLERMPESPDEILLKDDGRVNRDRTDTIQDIVRMRGNDYLLLNAQTAFDIGFSKGTADTLDELLSKMGITRNYSVVKNRSGKVLSDWTRDVNQADANLQRLLRQYREVQVKPPGGYRERTAARGQRKNFLRQMQSIADKYREAINPRNLGDADGIILQLDIIINRIDQEQRLDKPD